MPPSDTTNAMAAYSTVVIDSTDNTGTPYTSALLCHDTQLRESAELLITMHTVSQFVTASERVPLQARIDTLKALFDDA